VIEQLPRRRRPPRIAGVAPDLGALLAFAVGFRALGLARFRFERQVHPPAPPVHRGWSARAATPRDHRPAGWPVAC
jgi:hypothetical protein